MTLTPFPPVSKKMQSALGKWPLDAIAPRRGADNLRAAFEELDQPFLLVNVEGELGVADLEDGTFPVSLGNSSDGHPIVAYVPATPISNLGDPSFSSDLGLKYPYVAGAMANGIGSEEIVEAMGRAGMLGFFGAAGLPLPRVEAAVNRIQKNLGSGPEAKPYGFNLIHSPAEPRLESGVVDLYLKRGVRLVEASAYLDLTLPLVRYRLHGISLDARGEVVAPNRVIAKVSRIEVARRFFSPAAEKFVRPLVESGDLTPQQADWAARIPVAQDLTAEADSGGHTDNQPFVTLLPTLLALRDELQEKYRYTERLRVGAAGGIGTPLSAAAAFSMGAAYILTGSINQSCVEAGTSELVRQLLCQTRQADVAMAPAADMFEMGVRVQVLKRGTMFAMRAAKLYEIYRNAASWEEVPPASRVTLEKDYFRASFDEIWSKTKAFFSERDPTQLARADRDPKHKLALVFRWYLGLSSAWANSGDPTRQVDYQIWCGPAMGAFNEWIKGSFLESSEERRVVPIAKNLLHGAAMLNRISFARSQGVHLPAELSRIHPRPF